MLKVGIVFIRFEYVYSTAFLFCKPDYSVAISQAYFILFFIIKKMLIEFPHKDYYTLYKILIILYKPQRKSRAKQIHKTIKCKLFHSLVSHILPQYP